MQIEKSFRISRPRSDVWAAFADIEFVAACLPGASIVESLGDGKYKGKFSIKLGPLAASFGGEVAIERDQSTWTAMVSGKGVDQRSNSRANGSMRYRLVEDASNATKVEVVSEINLAGALAQFGKAAVIQEIAGRLTNEFARNFEGKLAARSDDRAGHLSPATAADGAVASGSAPQSLDAGALVWAVLKERLIGLFRRLKGEAV